MLSLLRRILKKEEEDIISMLRRLLAPLGKPFVVAWEFSCDVIYPGKDHNRPWFLAVIALLLSISSCASFSMLIWLLENQGKSVASSDFTSFFRSQEFKLNNYFLWGNFLLVVIAVILVGTVWRKIKHRGELEFDKELSTFCKWTTDAINDRTTCIHIAVNTPLIHIFHDKPSSETLSEYRSGDFEDKFCYPLCDKLAECQSEAGYIKFLYYSPEILRTRVPWFPAADNGNFDKYLKSIREFSRDVVRRHIRGSTDDTAVDSKIPTIFRETSFLPLWIAVIRGKRPAPSFSNEDTVILALTDQMDLTKEPDSGATNQAKKKFAAQLAKSVICIKSMTPDIVAFFDGVFMDMWQQEEIHLEHILDLLRRCRQGEKIEVLLREPYDAARHNLTPGEPSHIVYSTRSS